MTLRLTMVKGAVCGLLLMGGGFLSPALGAETGAEEDRVVGWRSDLDTLLAEIRGQHYIYRSRPLPADLLRDAERLRARIPELNDERILVELQRLMVHLGDGHSFVLPFGPKRVDSRMLPIRFYLFSDGLFVIDAERGNEQWIGRKVTRIGTTPVDEALQRLESVVHRDNAMTVKWIGPVMLAHRGVLETVASGIDPELISITLQSPGGGVSEALLAPIPPPSSSRIPKLIPSRLPGAPPPPLYLQKVAVHYWTKEMPEAQALYVQFNQQVDAPEESLAAFAERLGRHLTETKPRSTIVDVRHNTGGEGQLGAPLIESLAQYQEAGGRVFVITGRSTFSAAQIFISRLEARIRPVFAGEPSGSRPNFVGEDNIIRLPWSDAIANISTRYHETTPGDKRQWIEPSIRVDLPSADYFANRDPVLERVLAEARALGPSQKSGS
ncbi:MAG: hypothetical protein ACREAA_13700 [Candidatus Polarisedimenticolia bacterium]